MPFFWESLEVDENEMKMYVSVPSGPGPFPGVVVIHPASGVEQFTRDITDRLAGEGYAAVAPDLFHRTDENTIADGSTHSQHLSDPQIEADVNATVDFLLNHPSINGARLGIIGFCMGGRIAWLMAAANSHFTATVPYYGAAIMQPWGTATRTPYDRTSEISCPIMFHFGEEDANPSLADMAKFDAELTCLGKDYEFFTYPKAGHAFMDYTREFYQADAAEVSWSRTLTFFAKHLK